MRNPFKKREPAFEPAPPPQVAEGEGDPADWLTGLNPVLDYHEENLAAFGLKRFLDVPGRRGEYFKAVETLSAAIAVALREVDSSTRLKRLREALTDAVRADGTFRPWVRNGRYGMQGFREPGKWEPVYESMAAVVIQQYQLARTEGTWP